MALTQREKGVLDSRNPYTIGELNKGARHYGFTDWFDPLLNNNVNDTNNIRNQLKKFDGIWRTPLTTAERITIASQAQVKYTWDSLKKDHPDFEKAFKEYMDNRTQKPQLKKINKLNISAREKFNKMSGEDIKVLRRFNENVYQPFKNTIGSDEIKKLSNFKDMSSILGPVNKDSFNYKNGVPLLDYKFNRAHRAMAFQDYLKEEGIEKVELSLYGEGRRYSSKRRYKLTADAIKAGKTFKKILGDYPNLKSNPSEIYNNILARATRSNPIYIDTQGGLRSVFNFVKDSINADIKNYKPKFLKSMVENNPAMLRQVTGYVDPSSRTIRYQGVDGLKNLSDSDIRRRLFINTEHNRPMRDYASKYMEADRKTIKPKMLKYIDADMVHNISPASFWYNNSLKETATRLADANPGDTKLLNHLDREFKVLKQRFYSGDKFYGSQLEVSPSKSYGASVVDTWRNNYKGMGLEKSFDKYIGEYNLRGFGTVDNVLNGVKKDPAAIRQLGQFFGCPGTFKSFDEGGRVNLAAGGQGVAQCVETKLKNPENLEKLTQIEDTVPSVSRLKNFATSFLSVAKKGGRFGAFAAAGAATAGLVKEFRNDDPSTYLSNEDQQKNMLIDMLTQPVQDPSMEPASTAFGDAQLPAIGAVTAAGMVPGGAELYRQRTGSGVRKGPLGGPRLDADKLPIPKNRVSPFRALTGPLSGVLGKGLATTGTPLGMLALEPLYIGQQIADGDSVGEIATNPMNYLGPAFAGSLSKEATRFAGPKMANIMRLGISPTMLKMGSRRFGIPGLALSAGISGYEMYQNKKAGRGIFDDG